MTIVIMAACFDNSAGPDVPASPYVIAACDTLLITTAWSASGDAIVSTIEDGHISKIQKDVFLGRWLIGYSGDATPFLEICDRLRRRARSGEYTADAVPDALAHAYEDYRASIIQREILSSYKISSIDELMEIGLKRFGPKTFDRLCREIQGFNLGLDFVGAGFDSNAMLKLFRVVNPGVARPERIGSGAIATGSGAWHAEERLKAAYDPSAPLKHNIAKVLDAKLASEASPYVGANTTVLVMNKIGLTHGVPAESVNNFRSLWEQRRNEVPHEMTTAIELEGPLQI